MKKACFIIPLIIFTFPVFLMAQQTPPPDPPAGQSAIENTFGFGPRVGYYQADDADEGNFYGGIQFRGRFGQTLGLEAAVEYRAAQDFSFDDFEADTRMVPITGSLLLFVPFGPNFSPYGLAGLGAYYTLTDYSGDVEELGLEDFEEFNLGYHLGFGLEIPISSNVAFNADYRYLFLNPDDNEENLEGASFDGNTFTGSIMFYF